MESHIRKNYSHTIQVALWGPHEVTRNPEDTKSLIETIRAIPNIKTEEDLQVTKGFLTYYLSFVGPVHSAIFF